ncbi:hypothetical protein [Campylobacter majalis]|uniref:hypothetical protein n=1 Tax=Campylobacter majalis TaxID=2790656 RepID=UPI003D689D6A
MNRIEFIQKALDVNEIKANIINELIKPLADSELTKFFAFRTSFIQPMQSAELITKNAVYAYRKQKTLQAIKAGEFRFKKLQTLINFVQEFFKNERLCYGPASFKDFVIIGVDKDANLINHYAINQTTGKPKQLSTDSEIEVYEWLFKNQERIGVIKFIAQTTQITQEKQELLSITEQLQKDPDAPIPISEKALAMLEGLTKRIKK